MLHDMVDRRCLILVLVLVSSAGCDAPDHPFVFVTSGEEARENIEREGSSGEIPESASDFYHWDEGFLSDHTTYWSFTCASLEDCKLAAAPKHSSDELLDWEQPEYDFILKGPGYFGDKRGTDEWDTDKWDVTQIERGLFALDIRYDEKTVSELHYTAIDLDTLRFYRLRWYGHSLTEKLDEIGYKQP